MRLNDYPFSSAYLVWLLDTTGGLEYGLLYLSTMLPGAIEITTTARSHGCAGGNSDRRSMIVVIVFLDKEENKDDIKENKGK